MKTRKTNALEKLFPSVVNALVAFLLSLPFYFIFGFSVQYKLTLIAIFWLYDLAFILLNKNRSLGMMIFGTYWAKDYPIHNQLIYSVLYTLSFATVAIWIKFPFDLLLINLLLIQLPFVLIKGTTLHGYLSSNMVSVKRLK